MSRTRRTYCRICEAACGLVAELDADGDVARLRPDRDHPVSRGYVCAKGTRFLEVATHPGRLRHPAVRREPGAPAERASWERAVATIGERVRPIVERHGPHALGLYFGNPLAFNAMGSMALMAFVKSLGTRNVFSAGSQDCNNKFAGAKIVHGSPVIHPVPDLEHTELAIVFGSNPVVSQASFVHLEGGALAFDRIRERGGEVVWVDPRRTESAGRGGIHLPIRPATDVWLILALLRELAADAPADRLADPRVEGLERMLEIARGVSLDEAARRTRLAPEAIADLAGRIRDAGSTAFHMSVGVNQSGFGTLAYVALQALAHVSGNYDRRGGSVFHPAGVLGAHAYRLAGLTRERRSRVGDFESTMGTMPGGILADEIFTEGPDRIRAMIVVAGNPVTSMPGGEGLGRAFAELDFLACVDHFENETGALADVLLPSTSWLERWDLAMTTVPLQTGRLVQVSGPVMDPVGESRPDARILADVAVALGGSRVRWAPVRRSLDRWLPRPRYGLPGLPVVPGRYLGRGPLTPGHRVRFWDDALAADAPFLLLGRRRKLGHNSWIQGARREDPAARAAGDDVEAVAWMATEDLRALGLPEGGEVTIESDAGRLTLRAEAEDGLVAGTVVVPHGLPGLNVNAILPTGPAAVERISGQHVMTGIPARVEAAARADASPAAAAGG